jgi:hypothetical protein
MMEPPSSTRATTSHGAMWFLSRKLSISHTEPLTAPLPRTVGSSRRPKITKTGGDRPSGCACTRSCARAYGLRDYEVVVGEILALNAEGYPDSKIARRLTEEGFHSARGEEGVPRRFVTEVRRQHGRGSVSKALRSKERLEGCWTVLGLSKELRVDRSRIYKLIRRGVLPTERHPQTGNHLIEDDPELITDLRTRLETKPRSGNENAAT